MYNATHEKFKALDKPKDSYERIAEKTKEILFLDKDLTGHMIIKSRYQSFDQEGSLLYTEEMYQRIGSKKGLEGWTRYDTGGYTAVWGYLEFMADILEWADVNEVPYLLLPDPDYT